MTLFVVFLDKSNSDKLSESDFNRILPESESESESESDISSFSLDCTDSVLIGSDGFVFLFPPVSVILCIVVLAILV